MPAWGEGRWGHGEWDVGQIDVNVLLASVVTTCQVGNVAVTIGKSVPVTGLEATGQVGTVTFNQIANVSVCKGVIDNQTRWQKEKEKGQTGKDHD